MARLSIRLLGPLDIKLDRESVSGLESDKVRALLIFLTVARSRLHRRAKLAALLWPDWPERSARANLRRALANLRKALGEREAAQPFLLVTRQTIQFNTHSDAWVDVIALADLLSVGASHPLNSSRDPPVGLQTIRRLEDAIELYRGAFLEGFSLADSPAFDEWAMFQQERLHRQVMDALCHVASWYEEQGRLEQALQYAWRQVELNSWRESGHRQVMRLLAYSGQRGAALAQYRVCCQVLADELGVEAGEETVHLYERIRDGPLELAAAAPVASAGPVPALKAPAFMEEGGEERYKQPVFVARRHELERLDRWLQQAMGGRGRVVFVTGGPGRGKTALLGEFARRAMDAQPDLLVASGKCSAYAGVGDPHLPFRDIFALLTGDVEARWKAGTISRDHAQRLWRALPLVAQLLQERGSQVVPVLLSSTAFLSRATAVVPPRTSWLDKLAERIDRQGNQVEGAEKTRLFQQVTNVLHDLAEVQPLFLILDDLQWIDTASACLLFHLGRRLTGSRILIAAAYRPEELESGRRPVPAQGSARAEAERHPLEKALAEFKRRYGDVWIDLAGVSESEARHFVDAILDTESNSLGESFRESLFKHTGGHPLFTVEMLRAMQDRGDLLQDSKGRWFEGPILDWRTLPARVQGVIEERIGRLDEDLREVLSIASVEGEEFTAAVLAKVGRMDERQLLERLSEDLQKRQRLVQEQTVRPVGLKRLVRYRFAHALFQHYLYDTLSEGKRMLFHREIGATLEQLYEGHEEEIAAQLAYHYVGDAERERHYAKLAGQRAQSVYAHAEVVRYLSRALELTPDADSADRYALLLIRERAYDRQGYRELQCQDLSTLRRLATALGDSRRRVEVALRQSDYERVTGDYRAAIQAAQTAVELAGLPEHTSSDPDSYFEAAGYVRWGRALLRLADYQAARAMLERSQSLARSRLTSALPASEPPPGAQDRVDQATGRWQRLEANCQCCLGVVYWHLGNNPEAMAHYRRSLRICRETEDQWGQATALTGLGAVAWSEGSPAQAWSYFGHALKHHEVVGDRRGQCRALSNLGDVAVYWGDYPEAERLFGQALSICREIDEPWIESGIMNNLGIVSDRLGSYDEAATLLKFALQMRREMGYRQGEGETLSDLALVYHHLGDDEASLCCSEQAQQIIRELNDPFMLGFVLTRMGQALTGLGSLAQAVLVYREALLLRKEGGHTHLEVEPLAGLARATLGEGDSAQALEHVAGILNKLHGDDLSGNDEPLRVYLTCYRVTQANGDPSADKILEAAYHLLEERAAKIHPEELRHSFLENVAVHRQIVNEWRARGESNWRP